MEKEREIAYLIFDLIVKQLEGMSEQDRSIGRVEIIGSSLELTMKRGEEYRIEINRVHSPEKKKGRITMMERQSDKDERRIAVENWEELVHSCETVIQFLEYDKQKMEELSSLLPDFPWDKRSRMIEGILDQLREALSMAEGE